jgi:hypothetical protein
MPFILNVELLGTALSGLEYQIIDLDRRIAELRLELGATRPSVSRPAADTTVRKRRPMSAATRKRMAAAQRNRWAKQTLRRQRWQRPSAQ